MNEIYYYSEEIDYLLDDFRKILRELENDTNKEKINKSIEDINFINERIKTTKDAYFIEIKNLPAKDHNSYILKIKNKMTVLENLNMQYDFIKNKINYEHKEKMNTKKEQDLTPQDLEIRGNIIQDKTQESIYRMKKMVDESEQITQDAVKQLDNQYKKLDDVTDKIDDVEINISQAKQTLREIAKGAITDRFVRIVSLLIALILLILIVLIVVPRPR